MDLEQGKTIAVELMAHMQKHGVRRLRLGELEIELDPAAQFLNQGGEEAQQETEEDRQRKIDSGICSVGGCTDKADFLGTTYCRKHGKMGLGGVELS